MMANTETNPYLCSKYDKTFPYKSHLTRHMMICTREKLNQCKQCDKAFANKSLLTYHIRVHTGENHTHVANVTKHMQ